MPLPVNPLISLQAQAPDINQTFSNVLTNLQGIEQLKQAPAKQQLLQAQAQTAQAAVPTEQERVLKSVITGAVDLNRLPTDEDKLAFAQNRRSQIIERGKTSGQPVNTEDTDIYISKLESGDSVGAQQLLDQTIAAGRQIGIIESGAGGRGAGAGIKSFAPITIVNSGTGEKRLVAPTVDPASGQAVLEPFDLPEGFEVSKETDEEKRAADVLATGEKESKKLSARLKFKPQIEEAVITARKDAANRGDVFNELSQARAALPGLTAAVNELRELSLVATSTLGGKVFDAAVKETGFGATKGSTARAKFIAIINNQVLPLLKPTFGGSFSVQEGESLKATMGDPNSSPQEKIAQLDAFMSQKMRDIEAKESQITGATESATPQTKEGATATNPQTGQKVIFTNGKWQPAT